MSLISFADTTRVFGDDAMSDMTKKPDKVISHFKSMLGFNTSNVADKSALTPSVVLGLPDDMYYFKFKDDPERGSVKLVLNETTEMFPEEITAHWIDYTRTLAMKHMGTSKMITDASLTIPSDFTQRQRQAYIDACEIAGMRAISMVPETVAAALQHSFDIAENFTQNVVYYNAGSKTVEVCVVSWGSVNTTESGKTKNTYTLEPLSCVTDNTLGGQYVDIKIASLLHQRFKERYPKVEISNPKRLMKKFLKEALRVKHVLSANKNCDFYIEGITSDIDFKTTLKREDLESLLNTPTHTHTHTHTYADSLLHPLTQALQAAQIDTQNVTLVEMVGGAWRIPFVQETLQKAVPNAEFGQHLNGDEAMALGVGFSGANNSVAFRVRNVLYTDVAFYDYNIQVDTIEPQEEEYHKEYNLIPIGSRLAGATKTVTLRVGADVKLQLFENTDRISTYTITGLKNITEQKPKYAALDTPKIQLSFKVSNNGIIELTKAMGVWIETVLETVPINSKTSKNSTEIEIEKNIGTVSENSKNDTNSTHTEAAMNETHTENATHTQNETHTDTDAHTHNDTHTDTQTHNDTHTDTNTTITVPKEVTIRHTEALTITHTHDIPTPLTKEMIAQAASRLREFNRLDTEALNLAQIRNTFEAFIYESRNKLEEKVIKHVTTQQQRENITQLLADKEDWLYDGGLHANITETQSYLSEVRGSVNPVIERAREYTYRQAAATNVHTTVDTLLYTVNNITQAKPWITPEAKAKAENSILKFKQWFDETYEQQNQIPLTEPPVLKQRDVVTKIKNVEKEVQRLIKSPKPTEAPKPKVKDEKRTDTNETAPISENGTSPLTEPPAASTTAPSEPPTESTPLPESAEKEEL